MRSPRRTVASTNGVWSRGSNHAPFGGPAAARVPAHAGRPARIWYRPTYSGSHPGHANCQCRSGRPFVLRLTGFDVVDGARSRHRSAIGWFVGTNHMRRAVQMQITTIGLDIAKNV